MIEISEAQKVKVTFGVIFTVVGVLFGFAAWMTSVDLQAKEQNKKIEKIEVYLDRLDSHQDRIEDKLIIIDKRTTRIEVLLESKRGD